MKSFISPVLIICMVILASGCNKPSSGAGEFTYMWFDISGKVMNHAGHPIPGIRISAESAEAVMTDCDGLFAIRGGGIPSTSTSISCVDVDEESNGTYMSRKVMVELEKYKEGQGFAEGYYRNKNEVVVVMTESGVITPAIPGVVVPPAVEQ